MGSLRRWKDTVNFSQSGADSAKTSLVPRIQMSNVISMTMDEAERVWMVGELLR